MPQRHLIRGYHGTSISRAKHILQKDEVYISTNDYDWLGDGAYFFQDAPLRAWKWAKEWVSVRSKEAPAVISVSISLEDCFDLLDIGRWQDLLNAHSSLQQAGILPKQNSPVVRATNGARYFIFSPAPVRGIAGRNVLDSTVVKLAVSVRRNTGKLVKSVRGSFIEGAQLYDTSYFFDHSHVQIAVLDRSVIVPRSLRLEDSDELDRAYQRSGMTRWPV